MTLTIELSYNKDTQRFQAELAGDLGTLAYGYGFTAAVAIEHAVSEALPTLADSRTLDGLVSGT